MTAVHEAGIAGHPVAGRDEAARVRLAASPQTCSAVLNELAGDPLVTVRAALALNPGAAGSLNQRLAADGDLRVRTLLAHKLATLLPHVTGPERNTLREQVLATLSVLLKDEAARVRAAIAEALKDMPHAPRDLILRLAQDTDIGVSDPVVRLSPLLTSGDLLALLAHPPCTEIAHSIACRPGLDEAVTDAIAATANTAAVAALLRNPSAAIRESTLDALVARAAPNEEWHEPLVRHPRLSGAAARALSEFVATHLLETLAARDDLDAAVIAELRQRLGACQQPKLNVASQSAAMDDAMAAARAMSRDGTLDEATVLAAARQGNACLCAALLAVAAEIPAAVVERAATLRSAKGLVSLVWAAGFTMRLAVIVQELLGGLSPQTLLRATSSGDFPLAPDEMRWQLELLKRLGR